MSEAEPTRRDFLYVATGAVAAVGAAAALVPLIAQMNPDASTIAAGVPIDVDLAPIAEGQIIKVFWRGNPIFISHRTKKEIEEAQSVPLSSLPDPQADADRVQKGREQWLIVSGICTHRATAPCMIRLAASVRGPPQPIWRYRRTTSCPTAKSKSADARAPARPNHERIRPYPSFVRPADVAV
jgi:ubiquinol-cytochrome c reductase iron-sulfur subunit